MFWVVMSIIIAIIFGISVVGPAIGLYGDLKYEETGEKE